MWIYRPLQVAKSELRSLHWESLNPNQLHGRTSGCLEPQGLQDAYKMVSVDRKLLDYQMSTGGVCISAKPTGKAQCWDKPGKSHEKEHSAHFLMRMNYPLPGSHTLGISSRGIKKTHATMMVISHLQKLHQLPWKGPLSAPDFFFFFWGHSIVHQPKTTAR